MQEGQITPLPLVPSEACTSHEEVLSAFPLSMPSLPGQRFHDEQY